MHRILALDEPDWIGRNYRVVPNRFDGAGGVFVMFRVLAPGEPKCVCEEVRTEAGRVAGLWFESEGYAREQTIVEEVFAKLDLFPLASQGWYVQPNTVDNRGGAFAIFNISDLHLDDGRRRLVRPPLA